MTDREPAVGPSNEHPRQAIAWTIAGSDSGGGAGIQADLKTFHGLGVHGCSAITAVTAQNSLGVSAFEPTSSELLAAQLEALSCDLKPQAIKTGMLPDQTSMGTVAKVISQLQCPVICDPVMVATSGDPLMAPDARQTMIEAVFPHVDLLTPNLQEAAWLLDQRLQTSAQIEAAALAILDMGCRAVLIKGGHGQTAMAQDYYRQSERGFWISSKRHDSPHTHGSGCTLSAAITAACALGHDLTEAVVIGKAYVTQGIRLSRPTGSGHGCLAHRGWPEHPADFPWIHEEAKDGLQRLVFPPCGQLGFYPIVDRADWLERLFSWGVKTAQIRIKDLEGEALDRELGVAIELGRRFQARLFVNDYWQRAIELGAYGVHLGQEDLADADLGAIHRAGLRLGISTHNYEEVARANACRPSYIAIGPIYETTLKKMPYAPQGLRSLARWRRTLDVPLVAIAGINLKRAPAVLDAGADGIAVVSAITQVANPQEAVRTWLALWPKQA